MLFFCGVLLAGGAGAFTALLITNNPAGGPNYTPELLGQALPMTPRLTTLAVFCSGVALGIIFCAGEPRYAGSVLALQLAPGFALTAAGHEGWPHRQRKRARTELPLETATQFHGQKINLSALLKAFSCR